MNFFVFCRTHIGVFARGMCMGAADLVPGVSGGTIAFISGIYPRLLAAISACASAAMISDVLHLRFSAVWRRADGGFLIALAAGIVFAIFLLGGLLHHLLQTRAHLLLAFFFGLVVASAATTAQKMRHPKPRHLILFAFGAAFGLAVSFLPSSVLPPSLLSFFLGGAAAICAMILPGISGSYILLLAGLYAPVLEALHFREWTTIFIFAAGCAFGLLAFSRILVFLLRRFYDGMLAFLIGAMLGAVPKLWPWKEHGEGIAIILQPNISPFAFAADAQIGAAILLAIGGAILATVLYIIGRKMSESE